MKLISRRLQMSTMALCQSDEPVEDQDRAHSVKSEDTKFLFTIDRYPLLARASSSGLPQTNLSFPSVTRES